MVKNNEIVGYYDGQYVKDDYSGKQFCYPIENYGEWADAPISAHKEAVETLPVTSSTSGESVEEKEIRFSDYSTVVDQFFALLEA